MMEHPFLNPMPRIVAHRGDSEYFPENTLPAFRSAFELGVDVIETDVHLTKDGHIVIWHDPTLERNTNGSGTLESHTLNELKALDAGYTFTKDGGRTFPFRGQGVQLATLDEALRALPYARFNIDLKSQEEEIVDTVVTEHTPRCTQFQVVEYAAGILHEALFRYAPTERHGGEDTQTVSLGELRRPVAAHRSLDQITAVICIVCTQQQALASCIRVAACNRVGRNFVAEVEIGDLGDGEVLLAGAERTRRRTTLLPYEVGTHFMQVETVGVVQHQLVCITAEPRMRLRQLVYTRKQVRRVAGRKVHSAGLVKAAVLRGNLRARQEEFLLERVLEVIAEHTFGSQSFDPGNLVLEVERCLHRAVVTVHEAGLVACYERVVVTYVRTVGHLRVHRRTGRYGIEDYVFVSVVGTSVVE